MGREDSGLPTRYDKLRAVVGHRPNRATVPALHPPRPHAALVALDHLVDEAGLRDGDDDEEEGDGRHRGQVEVVAGDDLRLVEGV